MACIWILGSRCIVLISSKPNCCFVPYLHGFPLIKTCNWAVFTPPWNHELINSKVVFGDRELRFFFLQPIPEVLPSFQKITPHVSMLVFTHPGIKETWINKQMLVWTFVMFLCYSFVYLDVYHTSSEPDLFWCVLKITRTRFKQPLAPAHYCELGLS